MVNVVPVWDEQKFNREQAGFLAEELRISPLITGILLSRGLSTADEMREFLYGKEQPFYDPFLMKGMREACERIEVALAGNEKITIYGDYDVDGISATSVLFLYLRSRGAVVDTYIPRRQEEGYGLNDGALDLLMRQGTKLVVTVDCGISAVHEVAQASGLDVVITDHHTVPEELPAAVAIVNPHQPGCGYPFKDLSGVGVAFKLCQALEQRAGREWDEWMELVSLGTVADIVPLRDENREIVRLGLKRMAKSRSVGLRTLIKDVLGSERAVTSEAIAFGLAPKLNAAGRLDEAKDAVELLVTEDGDRAQAIVNKLLEENLQRQRYGQNITTEAEYLLAQEEHVDTAVVLGAEGWHQGVIGIVASRFVEQYHIPALLFSFNEGIAKGSCRSIPAVDLYGALAANQQYVLQFGGHRQAAGLTLEQSKFEAFKQAFKEYVREHYASTDFLPHQRVDYVLGDQTPITLRDLDALQLLEPCGCANPAPVFAYHGVRVQGARRVGKEQNHLQFCVEKGDAAYKAVFWNNGILANSLDEGTVADVAFQPRRNTFNGVDSVQLNILNIRYFQVEDYRRVNTDKMERLRKELRVSAGMDVFVQDAGTFIEECRRLGNNSRYLKVHSYEEPFQATSGGTVVLWDIPPVRLNELLQKLRSQGVARVLLYFNDADWYRFLSGHPDVDAMRKFYLRLRDLLKDNVEIVYDRYVASLPAAQQEYFSPVMPEVLAQLGLVKYEKGRLSDLRFVKVDIGSSPLFARLDGERKAWEQVFRINLHTLRIEFMHR